MLTTQMSLLERLRTAQDQVAWRRFVDLYSPLLLKWSERLELSGPDAEDLVQDVLLLLFRKLPGFEYDESRSFRAWLKTVFLNKHRERMRRLKPVTAENSAFLREVSDESEVAANDQEEAEDRQLLVQRGLELIRDEFPESTWRAFWEYAVMGRSPTDVATELGLQPGSVYAAKSRVLQRLRLELGRLFE